MGSCFMFCWDLKGSWCLCFVGHCCAEEQKLYLKAVPVWLLDIDSYISSCMCAVLNKWLTAKDLRFTENVSQ